jgi:hypothetical protein
MTKNPKAIKGAGTYSIKEILLNRREPLEWAMLNQQLTANEETYEIACFLHMNAPSRRMKWRQGTIVLSPDSIQWHPFWQKSKTSINILDDYKISELTWRTKSFGESLLKLKPQFFVLHAALNEGYVEFAIPETDIPLLVHRMMRHYGPSLVVQDDLEDTIKLVRQQAATS